MKRAVANALLVWIAGCCICLTPRPSAAQSSSNWAIGPKSILCIRVCYPDDVTEPVREEEIYSMMGKVSELLKEYSYGATWLTNVTVTPVLLMPHPKSYYSHGFSVSNMWDVAAQAGFCRSDYDIDGIFSVYIGLSNTSNGGTRTIAIFTPSVRSVCHELGHIYGLTHAQGWFARGGSIIGPGRNISYGNPFDTMGSGSGHYNACFKGHLEWLAQTCIQDIESNGLYRIYPFEVPCLTEGRGYALRISRSEQLPDYNRYYWLELRHQPTDNPSIQHGPVLCWGPEGTPDTLQEIMLLDTSPDYFSGSIKGFSDAPLQPCRTFSDMEYGIHITSMPISDDDPEFVEVQVNLGFFSGNHAPTVVLEPVATHVAVGEVIGLSATAVDQDGDGLVYAWDFGDGQTAFNQVSVMHHWDTDGEYVVRCSVSDMKGGVASAAAVVRVGNPATYRVTGHILADGQPLEGVRVWLTPTRSALSDSEGFYTLTGMTDGHYRLLPTKPYSQFTPTCLNVVISNNDVGGMDFEGMTTATPDNPPLVEFKSPVDGWVMPAGESFNLQVGYYADGPLTDIVFYDGTNVLVSGVPGMTWTNVPAGPHVLRAVATDDLGVSACSPDVAVTAVTGAPVNDDFANRIVLNGSVGAVSGRNVYATVEPGEPGGWTAARQSIWYSWIAPSNGLYTLDAYDSPLSMSVASVYQGSSLPNLTVLRYSIKSGGVPWPVVFPAEAGEAYPVSVDSASSSGPVAFSIRPAHPPANDDFANRTEISGIPVSVTGSLMDATLEGGDPVSKYDGLGSIWWSWTAPEDGTFTVNTEADGFQQAVVVFSGDSLPALVRIVEKGFAESSFKAIAGEAYAIEAYGRNGAGDIELEIRSAYPPVNDDFVDRIPLTGGVAVAFGSNGDATQEPGERNTAGYTSGSSAWWSWTAPFGGRFIVNVSGNGAQLLGVYTGSSVNNLVVVAEQGIHCNVACEVSAGMTYQISVDRMSDVSNPSIQLEIYPEIPRFDSLTVLSNGLVQFALAAVPSQLHLIEASDDLSSWTPIMTNWSYSSSVPFTNSDAAYFDHRFYRSVSP